MTRLLNTVRRFRTILEMHMRNFVLHARILVFDLLAAEIQITGIQRKFKVRNIVCKVAHAFCRHDRAQDIVIRLDDTLYAKLRSLCNNHLFAFDHLPDLLFLRLFVSGQKTRNRHDAVTAHGQGVVDLAKAAEIVRLYGKVKVAADIGYLQVMRCQKITHLLRGNAFLQHVKVTDDFNIIHADALYIIQHFTDGDALLLCSLLYMSVKYRKLHVVLLVVLFKKHSPLPRRGSGYTYFSSSSGTASAMALYAASLGCRWSPESNPVRKASGFSGSRTARSKSTQPSNASDVLNHSLKPFFSSSRKGA